MTPGQEVKVQANYSISQRDEMVTIKEIDRSTMSYFVEYSNDYKEWLPISAFQGY